MPEQEPSPPHPLLSLFSLCYPMDCVTHQTSLLMQEMRASFLGWEDPLEKEMTTHSSILAWEI